jgi:hypothetical protein
MPLAGLVVNRMQHVAAAGLTGSRAAAAAEVLEDAAGGGADEELAVALLRLHVDVTATAGRQRAHTARFLAAHPQVPVVEVPAAATDIHDLDGLREVATALAG